MFLALRELKHSKMRYVLIGGIMMLIAWLVFLLSGLANGLATDNGSSLKNMKADAIVFQSEVKLYLHRSLLPMSKLDEVKGVQGVTNAAPLGMLTVTTKDSDGTESIDATMLAIQPESFLAPKVIEGQALAANSGQEAVVDKTFKRHGVKLGDELKIQSSDQTVKVIGFTTGQTYNHLPVIFTNIPFWQKIRFAAPGSDSGIQNPISAIAVQSQQDGITDMLNQKLSGVETVTRDVALQNLPGYKEEMGTITMMLAFLFVIAAFVLAVFFYVLTLQKSNQFGVLKALGASTSYLAKNLLGQIFLLSLVSIVVGAGLTYLVAAVMPGEVPFALDNGVVVVYSVILLIVSMLGAMISLRRIAKIDALQAIGKVE
ncbi:ABC transporter permease [Tumebacillus flagellatus]|uniref:Putative hemin transport system permease protein HrtB n=1 Tax=Tumebacillus flagellatus TaxID=1157490 RepID=A0A074LJF7_9BACL|nr:ABC transporter permease [Tumebacillus flagellatus]KEO81234.1 hypothetical protein EL26_21750 [Tumebacillus flagellatus]